MATKQPETQQYQGFPRFLSTTLSNWTKLDKKWTNKRVNPVISRVSRVFVHKLVQIRQNWTKMMTKQPETQAHQGFTRFCPLLSRFVHFSKICPFWTKIVHFCPILSEICPICVQFCPIRSICPIVVQFCPIVYREVEKCKRLHFTKHRRLYRRPKQGQRP